MDNNDTFIRLSDRGDMALLRDVAAGREDAFMEIMNRYLPLISRTTFRILCDRNDSESVAKQVFIYLWHNFDQYDDRFTLEEWLLRRTFYLSRLRISRRRILHVFGKRPALFAVSKPKAENTDDYITTQAWELFCRTSLKMTPVQRVVFTFVDLEQLGQEKTAYVTGLFRYRVRIAEERAEKKLKEELAGYGKVDDYEAYVGFMRKVSDGLTDLEAIKLMIFEDLGLKLL